MGLIWLWLVSGGGWEEAGMGRALVQGRAGGGLDRGWQLEWRRVDPGFILEGEMTGLGKGGDVGGEGQEERELPPSFLAQASGRAMVRFLRRETQGGGRGGNQRLLLDALSSSHCLLRPARGWPSPGAPELQGPPSAHVGPHDVWRAQSGVRAVSPS